MADDPNVIKDGQLFGRGTVGDLNVTDLPSTRKDYGKFDW